jgi:PIN domain nuclease of toxin-antitoxin system
MRILVDTHVYFWWVTGDRKLSAFAHGVLEDTSVDVLVSAVVPWELATKGRLGKWPSARQVVDGLDAIIESKGLQAMPVTTVHARLAGLMPGPHRDPFDRMLAAQARLESASLVTADRVFRHFDIDVIW